MSMPSAGPTFERGRGSPWVMARSGRSLVPGCGSIRSASPTALCVSVADRDTDPNMTHWWTNSLIAIPTIPRVASPSSSRWRPACCSEITACRTATCDGSWSWTWPTPRASRVGRGSTRCFWASPQKFQPMAPPHLDRQRNYPGPPLGGRHRSGSDARSLGARRASSALAGSPGCSH